MKIIDKSWLKHLIKNDNVIAIAAISCCNLPAEFLKEIIQLHDVQQEPNQLTFLLANDISDYTNQIYDLDAFVERGMVKCLIMSIMIGSPKTIQAMKNNDIEAYYLPQGVIATHYRNQTSTSLGTITKIGLNTTVDPLYEGGKINSKTTKDLVKRIEIEGETYLKYEFPNIDVALLRGTYTDKDGNIYMTEEAHLGEGYSVALAARRNKGKVIVQVKAIIENGRFNPKDVFIPSALVDYIFINQESKYHKQVVQTYYDPALAGEYRLLEMPEQPIPLSERKLILRRASQYLNRNDVVSIGFGINNELSNILVEEKADHLVQLNMDTGVFGGWIGSRKWFGMNYNVEARMRHDMTWDFIYSGGIDVAFLSFAEVDQHGNVNVSEFGDKMNGCGGFIDISQSVKKIIFSGSLVVKSKLALNSQKVEVMDKGKGAKFVNQVHHVDFNAMYALEMGQEIYYVTERAVFQLTPKGIMLIEIAPDLDLKKDVLEYIEFNPLVSPDLKRMDRKIYHEIWGELAHELMS